MNYPVFIIPGGRLFYNIAAGRGIAADPRPGWKEDAGIALF